MSDQEMTQEQQESVERLAQSEATEAGAATSEPAVSDSRSSDGAISTSDLASADDDADQETRQAEPRQAAVGVQPRQDSPRGDDERTPVMSEDAAEEYRGRWQETQADFVDDPRSAVAAADALVAEVMKRVAEEFATERSGLEKQWNEGGEASTEDLRVAFQRYRSFFSRLLSL